MASLDGWSMVRMSQGEEPRRDQCQGQTNCWGTAPIRKGEAIVKRLLGIGALALATAGIGFVASKITAQNTGAVRPAEARSKVALLNLSHVLKNYTKAMAIQNELKDMFQPLQTRQKAKAAQMQQLAKEAQAKPDQREILERQARAIKRELEDLDNEAQTLLGKKQDETLVNLYKEVQDASSRVAMASGFDMVLHYNDATTSADYWSPANIARKFQAGACMPLYFTPGTDISADVINALNTAYSKANPGAGAAGSGVTPTGATAPAGTTGGTTGAGAVNGGN